MRGVNYPELTTSPRPSYVVLIRPGRRFCFPGRTQVNMNIGLIENSFETPAQTPKQSRARGRVAASRDARRKKLDVATTADVTDRRPADQLVDSFGGNPIPAPTQIVVVNLAWRKGWLTKERRSILKSIVDYDNRYLGPAGGGATLRFGDGGARVTFSTPWHALMCCHDRLAQWAKREGCYCNCVELTEAA